MIERTRILRYLGVPMRTADFIPAKTILSMSLAEVSLGITPLESHCQILSIAESMSTNTHYFMFSELSMLQILVSASALPLHYCTALLTPPSQHCPMSSDGPSLTIVLAVTFLSFPSVQKPQTRLPQGNEKR